MYFNWRAGGLPVISGLKIGSELESFFTGHLFVCLCWFCNLKCLADGLNKLLCPPACSVGQHSINLVSGVTQLLTGCYKFTDIPCANCKFSGYLAVFCVSLVFLFDESLGCYLLVDWVDGIEMA